MRTLTARPATRNHQGKYTLFLTPFALTRCATSVGCPSTPAPPVRPGACGHSRIGRLQNGDARVTIRLRRKEDVPPLSRRRTSEKPLTPTLVA